MRLVTTILLVFISVQSIGQDTHYWTYRYGTRAVLMGGSAVGGLEDNSSVIYNPALLSLVKSTSVSINSNVYQVVNITVKDGAGAGQDVTSNQFSAVPVTVSGLIKKKKTSRWTMGYAIIVPTEFTFKATARQDALIDIVNSPKSPGSEDYVGQFSINTRLSENQGAFAIAFKMNKHWSIGLTNQFIYRSHNYAKSELSRAIMNDTVLVSGQVIFKNTLVSTGETQSVEYTNLRYVPKFGIAFSSGNWSAGIAIAMPSINLTGSGTIFRDVYASNLYFPLKNIQGDGVVNDRQTAIPTTYKSPLSISVGFTYRAHRTLIAVSTEWFGKIDLYDIMLPVGSPFKRPTDLPIENNKFLQLNASNKSVTNFSIGIEHELNEKVSICTGFRTNNSFYDRVFDDRISQGNIKGFNKGPINLDISAWNMYHVVIGGTFKKERRDLSIGVNFSWADEGTIKQFANFEKPTQQTFLVGQRVNTTASMVAYGIVLGYTFHVRSTDR